MECEKLVSLIHSELMKRVNRQTWEIYKSSILEQCEYNFENVESESLAQFYVTRS